MLRKKFLSMALFVGMLISQSAPHVLAATVCDHAQFVSDLTAPDGSSFAPGTGFTKTWRLMNVGSCTWTTAYNLVWSGGDSLGAPLSVTLPVEVPPGQMVDVSVALTAPAAAGHYRASFKISNASGGQFGIGESAGDPFWADINVIQTSAVIYDFVANSAYAQWKSGAGPLPFPGTSGDSRGFSYQVNSPHLEDDSFDPSAGMLFVPQNKFNGYIQATYPEFQIQQGDRLQTLVNCEFGATNCYVTFRIDYLLPNGAQRTLWSWREAYDKRFYRADLDLSALSGQKVRFVFMLLSTGFASGDRALWGAPRIVRAGTTQPPAPPPTLTPLPPLPPSATPLGQPPPTVAPSGCDRAAFVTDVTVPDGTIFAPGAAFTKTWRLKNIGSCTWTTSYKLMYYSGELMNAPAAVNLPWNVGFDQTVDISVNMVAPGGVGKYRGFWILSNASGQLFGIGANASNAVWVEINVAGDSPVATGYDFTSNVCSAEWKSGAGILPCPGTNGNSSGFILRLDTPKMEDGSTGAPGLLAAPQNRYNGYIQGFYPTFTVQPGDRFQTAVGCEFGAACYLTYRLDYMTASGYIGTFWQWREQNEGRVYNADVDLSPLAGRSVRFILTILATGSATNDRALWGSPRIARAGSTPTPITPGPSLTPIPPGSDWLTYSNAAYGFQFKYPPQAQIVDQSASSLKINLPFMPGTNLREKYLQMSVRENINPCLSPLAMNGLPVPPEAVIINGISFLKQTAADAGVGHLHEWVAYSTPKNNACISMDFVLHSLNAGNFATPIPEFDKAAESAVFTQIMSTFGWATATVTPVPPTAPPVVVPSPDIRKLFMIDPSNGWAIGNAYVLRTSDGGATWYNITAPGVTSVRNGFFLNARQGWMLSTDSIYRTTDGGSTWTRYTVPFNGGHLQFLNDSTGFVLTGELSGMHKHAVSLYQTSDGGATWTLKYAVDPYQANNTLPFGGNKNGMTFRDTSTGWINGYTPTAGLAYLYKTTNGGASWAPQSLPIPAGYESADINTGSPMFFGANDGILPVWISTSVGGRSLFIYVTRDGGATWSVSSSPAPASFAADFVTVQDGFSLGASGLLHVTNNSGASWGQVTPNVSLIDGGWQLDFVSLTIGWAFGRDLNGNTTLYRTNDGGANWTRLFGNAATSPTSTPQPPTPSPDPVAFAQSIVNGLNARNFDAMRAMMDQSFTFAYWESQGFASTPEQAIENLRNSNLSATPLTPDAAKDLHVLLGGFNPYTVMGLDPSRSQALFVSGWGTDGTGEAILYATRRADGSLYWYGVLIAPYKFIHATPTPISLTGPYAVVNVAGSDVLNIRASAGVNHPVVGSFAPGTVNIMRTGSTASADNAAWVEVQRPDGGTGWVNSYYLTEYVSHDAFCADSRIPGLIDQLKQAMNQSNGALLGALVSPTHGMNLNYWASSETVNYTSTTVQSVFTDPQVITWGSGGGSGNIDTGTFAQVVQPEMIDVLNSAYQLNCDALTYGQSYTDVSRYASTPVRFYSVVKPPTMDLDWKVWLIRIEYVNGQPYIFGAVHYVWEP